MHDTPPAPTGQVRSETGQPGAAHGWYVDSRCTNCDVARQLAPALISEVDGHSQVLRQPQNASELRQMYAAAYACHTRSIRRADQRLESELDPFPMLLEGDVHLCGHNSPHTAGANSYLLRRPSGSMLIDTPRYSAELAARYEAKAAPVTDVLLTHRDHAAHGRQYADHFGARLWIHEGDLDAAPEADRVLRGTGPSPVGEGVVAHPLPGHTRGSVLYVADERYCFSGDSFYWSRTTGDIEVSESVTWYSIEELGASLTRTAADLRFTWLLPGHGGRKWLPEADMSRRLLGLAARTRQLRPQPLDFTAVRW
ncbi:MBL fold metallo-hydrolase [Streptomyces winkii]|uniref:MBL fold metallo-hydrolase n=1 Tax=Streptomyces winkii TaxID=3051178 RepID=UPI0028D1300C|nr:MBL fold metallo-hydrolase [Streptomyces sp. DSM 40971]